MKKWNIENLKQEFDLIHNFKYSYENFLIYENNKIKIEIICPTHGSFLQKSECHLRGQGCPECKKDFLSELKRKDTYNLLLEIKEIHGNVYEYNLANYKNVEEKIEIICKTHGSFYQNMKNHLLGQGCPKCYDKNKRNLILRNSLEEFIEKSNSIHNFKYDYSKVNYFNNKTPVEIICPIHGSFFKKRVYHIIILDVINVL